MEKNIRNSTGGRDSNEHKMPEDINRLSEALNDVDAVMGFKQFLDKIHSTEHLYFWMEVEVYKKLKDSKEVQRRANDIFAKYFDPESLYEVNVPAKIVEELTQETKKQQATTTLFDKAQKSVFELMELDSWDRYRQDECYQKFSEEMKKKRKVSEGATTATGKRFTDDLFYKDMYEGFHQMLIHYHGNKKQMYSTDSIEHLQELIKKRQSETKKSAPATPKNIRLSLDKQSTSQKDNHKKTNKKEGESSEDDSDDEEGSDGEAKGNRQHGLIQTALLSNMLIPLHGVVGSLTQPKEDSKQTDSNSHAKDLRRHFEDVLENEQLRASYFCSYSGKAKLLYSGKLYITDHRICFYANILGADVKVTLPICKISKLEQKMETFKSIVSIDKANCAVVLPNALEIKTIKGEKVILIICPALSQL